MLPNLVYKTVLLVTSKIIYNKHVNLAKEDATHAQIPQIVLYATVKLLFGTNSSVILFVRLCVNTTQTMDV